MSQKVMACFNMKGTNRHEKKSDAQDKLSFEKLKVYELIVGIFFLFYNKMFTVNRLFKLSLVYCILYLLPKTTFIWFFILLYCQLSI